VTLHLFDSATRDARAFVPLRPGEAGIYMCGATVQGVPHIGHLRCAVAFDVLVRWLERSGYRVTLVRNVTDIDDKILTKSADAGVPWWAWAHRNERAFSAAYDAVGCRPATYEPRATGHIPEMLALIGALVDAGHAYAANGSVYFDVRSFAGYGALTNQGADDATETETEAPAEGKRDARDFALWKATKPDDPETASWVSPWGPGRPGWHIECSAMAERYLGAEFDIHGGGLDLRFPHHENERAQSMAAGRPFARTWMHSAWLTQSGTKMSKSLGNTLGVPEVLARCSAPVLRLALVAVHYRSMVEYTENTLTDAEATWARLEGFVRRAGERVGQPTTEEVRAAALPGAFVEAMNDDLAVPRALAVIHESVTRGNAALAGTDDSATAETLIAVRAMLDALGLDPASEMWSGGNVGQRTDAALDALVRSELAARDEARVRRDFATADAIRDRLTAAGISVEDGADGSRWSISDGR
jgi:cysteinyl-tRNA synthetase